MDDALTGIAHRVQANPEFGAIAGQAPQTCLAEIGSTIGRSILIVGTL